jgi:hypothetical protein
MIRLKLLTRPDCRLCDEMKREVDTILGGEPHIWEIVNVDSQPDLAARYGESIPVLFVNDRLFAKVRLPNLAGLRSLRSAAAAADEA